MATYSATSTGSVDLTINNGGLISTAFDVQFGGVRVWAPWVNAGDKFLTKPLRTGQGSFGESGRGIEDTILFVIHLTPGQNSYVDDDSGVVRHSQIAMPTACSGTSSCHALAGGFSSTLSGNLTVFHHRPSDDSDGDGMDNTTELHATFGTSTTNADTDGDGIGDFAELIGIKAPSLTGVDASVILPYQDAAPTQQDVFIEVDYMSDGGHSHAPDVNIPSDLTGMWSLESGWTGGNVRPHVEVSQNIGHWLGIDFGPCNAGTASRLNFYTIKNNPSFFNRVRLPVYHYVIAAHNRFINSIDQMGNPQCFLDGASSVAEVWGNDAYISLGTAESRLNQRGTYAHEVGHNYNLVHHDNDQSGRSCIHTSVMNYAFQLGGWGNSSIPEFRRYSYSRGNCDNSTSVTSGGTCDNTCVNRCVPAGQVTPKTTCPLDLFWNVHRSNGTCDCDYQEWTQELNLAFAGSGEAADGSAGGVPLLGRDRRWLAPYLMGDGLGLTAEHMQFAQRKRALLASRGLREGVDFTFDSRNGKFYATE